jgi:hypothetical protein
MLAIEIGIDLVPDGPWEMTVMLLQLGFFYVAGWFMVRLVHLAADLVEAIVALITAPLRGWRQADEQQVELDGGRDPVEQDRPPEDRAQAADDLPPDPAHQNQLWPPEDAFND